MAGIRDILIHNYLSVDLEIIWNAITRNLPKLKEQVEKIVN